MATVHLMISGKVQGVFFRASAKEKALELALNGWIKNTPDGSVEATVSDLKKGFIPFYQAQSSFIMTLIIGHLRITVPENIFYTRHIGYRCMKNNFGFI